MEKQLNMISFWLQGVSEVWTVAINQGIYFNSVLWDFCFVWLQACDSQVASRVDRSTMNSVGLLVGMDKSPWFCRSFYESNFVQVSVSSWSSRNIKNALHLDPWQTFHSKTNSTFVSHLDILQFYTDTVHMYAPVHRWAKTAIVSL